MLGVLIGGCALFGLVVGSFLNVVIYRIPRHESIVAPRSHCPRCAALIKEYDNIPVLSWLILRGRCRNCGEKISPRYLFVELGCGALFAGLAARLGFSADLPAFLVLFAGLLSLAFIDAEHLILPKRIVYPLLALVTSGLVAAAWWNQDWRQLLVAAICSLTWFVLFFLLNFAAPRMLGFGDVRFALVLGLGLGWFGWRYAVLGFFVANLVGALIGITLLARKKISREQPIPYGVFLSIGAAVSVYAGPEVISTFQNLH